MLRHKLSTHQISLFFSSSLRTVAGKRTKKNMSKSVGEGKRFEIWLFLWAENQSIKSFLFIISLVRDADIHNLFSFSSSYLICE